MWRQVHRCRFWLCHNYFFFFLILNPLRHCGAAPQAEILGAASGVEMAELHKWRRLFHSSRVKFPLVNMSASWCLVSMYLIWILGFWFYPIKQQIQSSSVVSWHMSHCRPPPFDDHFNYCFVVLRNREHRTKSRRLPVRRNMINIIQIQIVVLGWSSVLVFGVLVWCGITRRVMDFDTAKQSWRNFSRLTSIHVLSRRGIEMEDNVTASFSRGLALATGLPAALCTTFSREMVSDVSVTYLLIPFKIRTQEAVPSRNRDSINISSP